MMGTTFEDLQQHIETMRENLEPGHDIYGVRVRGGDVHKETAVIDVYQVLDWWQTDIENEFEYGLSNACSQEEEDEVEEAYKAELARMEDFKNGVPVSLPYLVSENAYRDCTMRVSEGTVFLDQAMLGIEDIDWDLDKILMWETEEPKKVLKLLLDRTAMIEDYMHASIEDGREEEGEEMLCIVVAYKESDYIDGQASCAVIADLEKIADIRVDTGEIVLHFPEIENPEIENKFASFMP